MLAVAGNYYYYFVAVAVAVAVVVAGPPLDTHFSKE